MKSHTTVALGSLGIDAERWAADRRSWESSRRLKSDRGGPTATRPGAQYLSGRLGVTTLFCAGRAAVPGYRGAVPGGYRGGRVDIVVPVRYTGIVSTHRMTAVRHGDLDDSATAK
jgi:hypothetical protein